MFNEKAQPRQLALQLPTVAAGTGITYAIFNPSFAGEIVSVNISNHGALATDPNSYTTLALIDNTTTTHTIATLTNSGTGVALTADVFSAFTMSTTNKNKRFASGDAIVFNKAETGAGSAITTPTLWIEYIAGTYDA